MNQRFSVIQPIFYQTFTFQSRYMTILILRVAPIFSFSLRAFRILACDEKY